MKEIECTLLDTPIDLKISICHKKWKLVSIQHMPFLFLQNSLHLNKLKDIDWFYKFHVLKPQKVESEVELHERKTLNYL